MIYDDVLNITWLQNANYAGSDMTWNAANAWAANLSYFDDVRNVTYTDWRLPHLSVAAGNGFHYSPVNCMFASELDCRDNEFGYMYYHNLNVVNEFGQGGIGNQVADGVTLNTIQQTYWSTSEYCCGFAWGYNFIVGTPTFEDVNVPAAAWAVRDGDVAAVPEPASLILLGMGLLGLRFVRRRS